MCVSPGDAREVRCILHVHADQPERESDRSFQPGEVETRIVGVGCFNPQPLQTCKTYLLDVDDVVVVLGKLGSDGRGVGGLVARHVVAVEDGGQAGHVHGQDAERARGCCCQCPVQQQDCGECGAESLRRLHAGQSAARTASHDQGKILSDRDFKASICICTNSPSS